MGSRGASSGRGKKRAKKKGSSGGGVSNAGALPQSIEKKLNPIQIKLKKKLFANYHEKREQWKRIGSKQTINYDKSDKRITRTQGEAHVSRVSRWRKDTYFRDYKSNGKSAVQIQSGKMKKRWAEHFNEHHNSRRDGLNSGFVNAKRIRER